MTARLNLLPEPRFEALHQALLDRMRAAAELLDADTFPGVLDGTMRAVLEAGFAAAGAHEGSLWLVDVARTRLTPVYNNGPDAARFVGHFEQPLQRQVGADGVARGPGIISAVFHYEQPFCENDVHVNATHDATLDATLRVVTTAMIAVPFYFAREKRGVISCVQLRRPGAADPPGFPAASLRPVQLAAQVVGRLLDHALLAATTGWVEP